mmetsp:Transcript_44/g.65  ORF Transcript_44/g.65 Transcript_44/m.65 type:complete len:103 (-) Transcript_44:271-579(-)|eukprot:CAMPEP_0202857020 /NCGR_PEP_ID=MMETSP1391-20130828/111_1 /ASSEMBLY_ACC=CAM_ASM_000867 /TAXON_ID=1034604 /ORGANISM="Chlamydomonas leiostraca, Strain SAG 11-49" /LENGTH=102 /DNA_ID=CAMNT_0049535765 /DNA_START=37 /DNA_END=345 /DNA_ORIENTATION=-
MQSSICRVQGATLKNPLLGNTISYRVAAAPCRPSTASRDVVTMARKKGIRLIVTVECTEAKGEGAPPSRYTTQKNRKNTPDRLELMKYNPNLKRHTLHKEIK